MAMVGSLFDPMTELLDNKHLVWVVVRPAIPKNDTHW